MRALDTNVLARFFVDDPDDEQAALQRPAAIAALSQRAFVSATVLLELEWVLRGFYQVPVAQVCAVFRALVGIEHITIEDRDAVLLAVEWAEQGMDFADSLHVARSARASSFVTFDQKLVKRAQRLGVSPQVSQLE
jgi:predicted nucleic-acid-binding protein